MMNPNICISIAIPAYKAFYLKEAIQSVLSQTYSNWELIILNDASPENIKGIVSEFISDSRIKYYENDRNVGALEVVKNWNKCLELSEGDFFLCMGDDDLLYPHCLDTYVKYINKFPEYDLFHGATEIIDENGNFYNYQEGRPLKESVFAMAWQRLNRKRDQFIGDFLFRSKRLKELNGFFFQPLAWSSDDITSYLCAGVKGVVNINKFIFKYRVNSHSISNTGQLNHKLTAIQKEQEWYKSYFFTQTQLNDSDKNYQYLISNNLDKAILRKQISTIAEMCKDHFFRSIRSLYKYHKENKLSIITCLKGICLGIIFRFNQI